MRRPLWLVSYFRQSVLVAWAIRRARDTLVRWLSGHWAWLAGIELSTVKGWQLVAICLGSCRSLAQLRCPCRHAYSVRFVRGNRRRVATARGRSSRASGSTCLGPACLPLYSCMRATVSPAGTVAVQPNPSLKLTRYGRRCKPGPRPLRHHREPGLQRPPPRAA